MPKLFKKNSCIFIPPLVVLFDPSKGNNYDVWRATPCAATNTDNTSPNLIKETGEDNISSFHIGHSLCSQNVTCKKKVT